MNLSKHKTLITALTSILLMTGIILSLFAYQMHKFIQTPADDQKQVISFTITPGQSLNQVAANLEKKRLISNLSQFKLYVRYKKATTQLRAGEDRKSVV